MKHLRFAVAGTLLLSACGVSTGRTFFNADLADSLAGDDAAMSFDDAGHLLPGSDGGMVIMNCDPNAPDQQMCTCVVGAAPRACYPVGTDPKTRNVGVCKDGTQTCVNAGEFSTWSTCTGAKLPDAENCTNGLDDNCDGRVDCADASCAMDPACMKMGCKNGDTRACYDGPGGTLGVGICHAGTQACANGMWAMACTGEQVPEKEHCDDAKDHDCNHLPGCLDLFACILDPACMGGCSKPDNGCTCPMGAGDTATCPQGEIGKPLGGGFPPQTQCCPCTKNDCGNPGCCAEPVCANDPQCKGMMCQPLDPGCHGMVNADCDDFPEDCDEPCCKCRMCP